MPLLDDGDEIAENIALVLGAAVHHVDGRTKHMARGTKPGWFGLTWFRIKINTITMWLAH